MSQARTLDFEPAEECSIEEDRKRTRPQQEQMTANKAASQVLPESISNRFFESKGTYYFPDRTPAFAEKDGKLTMRTKELNPEVVKAFVSIAEDRGWSAIKATGSKEFRQAVWLEAASRGLEVTGYTPTETEKAWAEQKSKAHNAVVEDKDKKRDNDLDFEQRRSQSAPERAAMLRSDDKSTIRQNPELAKAFAGVAAAKQVAKRRFQEPEQQQQFVAAVRERYAQKMEQGKEIQGPALRRASVVQFKEALADRSKPAAAMKAQTENERIVNALTTFSPPDPQALLKSRGAAGKLTQRLIEGGMTAGEATTAVAFNALVFSNAPKLHDAQSKLASPMKADPEVLVDNYKKRMASALKALPDRERQQAIATIKDSISRIDSKILLREAKEQASAAESPSKNGRRLDTRNPQDFYEFLRNTGMKPELIQKLITDRENQKKQDPHGYAKALQDERKFFEKNRLMPEQKRNLIAAEYLLLKGKEQPHQARQAEQNQDRAPTERSKATTPPAPQKAPAERTKKTELERCR